MSAEISGFKFELDSLNIDPSEDYIAVIPNGIHDKSDLLRALKTSLELPDYFGNNWDALDECIKDLSWISKKRIIILHNGVPNLEVSSLSVYLSILHDAIRTWKLDGQHKIEVFFPKEENDRIATAWQEPIAK